VFLHIMPARTTSVERCLACEADAVGTLLGRAFRRLQNVKAVVTRFGPGNFRGTCFGINAQRSPTAIGLASEAALHSCGRPHTFRPAVPFPTPRH
jgi:hypothetical protein